MVFRGEGLGDGLGGWLRPTHAHDIYCFISIKWSRGWPALSEVESLLDKRLDLLYTVGFDLLRASISIFDHSIP
jgi:hypothetical protein